jgi:hypothetical protein
LHFLCVLQGICQFDKQGFSPLDTFPKKCKDIPHERENRPNTENQITFQHESRISLSYNIEAFYQKYAFSHPHPFLGHFFALTVAYSVCFLTGSPMPPSHLQKRRIPAYGTPAFYITTQGVMNEEKECEPF